MEKQVFPTEVVLGCVSLSRNGNPIVHSEVMLPLIHFVMATPEKVLRQSRSKFITDAVACGIALAQKYPKLDKVDYPQGYKVDLEPWLKKQYGIFGETMEIEPLPKGFSLTQKQHEYIAEVVRRWA